MLSLHTFLRHYLSYRERGARRRYFASVIVSVRLAADILLQLSRARGSSDEQKLKMLVKTDAATNRKRLMQAGGAICCTQTKSRNKSKGHNDN